MDNNITIQNTISIGIEIPPETFINEKTINVQNLIIESSSTNNGTICIPDNVSNNIVVPSKKKKIFILLLLLVVIFFNIFLAPCINSINISCLIKLLPPVRLFSSTVIF